MTIFTKNLLKFKDFCGKKYLLRKTKFIKFSCNLKKSIRNKMSKNIKYLRILNLI